MTRPTITMLVGLTGSGKTTLAKKLASETRQLHFSIDEWMQTLFWMDSPTEPQIDWALERCARCEKMMAKLLEQELRLGRGIILDLGFSKKSQRSYWRNTISALGGTAKMIFLDVSAEERWRRVESRNKLIQNEKRSISVDRKTFDWMESFFEPLDEEERAILSVSAQSQMP